jgi:glycosyltransferase involved in cell wall biosynthesis
VHIAFVIPAWRRYAVTNLALAQQAHLRGALAARGITSTTIVVADDDNLDIAQEHGCHTVEQTNAHLGRKVNDGIEYACDQGADWVSFAGSDDWLHEDALEPIFDFAGEGLPPLIAGHLVTIVDLEHGKLRRLGVRGPDGVSPWLIPHWMLSRSHFRPVPDTLDRGMEGALRRALPPNVVRVFHDPHEHVRVDFKTSINMTPYTRVSRLLGYGPEEPPWDALADHYPDELVQLARETHDCVARDLVAA